MLEPLVAGLLAGWGVAIPLGAIGVMIVDLGMRGGLRPAAAAAAGVATADLLYAAVAAAAGAAVAGALAEHERALRLVAAAVLVAVAVIGLRMALRAPRDESGPAAVAAAAPGGRAVYLRFVALTSVNPLTVAYFAALIAGLPAVASSPAADKAVFVVAAGAASLSWQLVLAAGGAALHHRLPPSARLYTALAVRMAVAA